MGTPLGPKYIPYTIYQHGPFGKGFSLAFAKVAAKGVAHCL